MTIIRTQRQTLIDVSVSKKPCFYSWSVYVALSQVTLKKDLIILTENEYGSCGS
uniref:Uncharacterized protein n=1 Tax=Arundo donax TaxID=35708 RepID=A0A0A9B8P6_ARUDO